MYESILLNLYDKESEKVKRLLTIQVHDPKFM